MKMNIIISLLLVIAVANAAVLTVDSHHVFEGEEFTVTYTANAPLSQQKTVISFADQEKTINLPTMAVGTFSSTIAFIAPQKGTYEVAASDARAEVVVEPALLVLRDVAIAPKSISPRETAKLSYSIENIGDVRVYNVKSRLSIPASDQFSYNADEQELFSEMAPGEKIIQNKEIRARENAAGEINVEVAVSYEYDNEIHTRREWVGLGIDSMQVPFIGVIALLVIIVAVFALSRGFQHKSQ